MKKLAISLLATFALCACSQIERAAHTDSHYNGTTYNGVHYSPTKYYPGNGYDTSASTTKNSDRVNERQSYNQEY